MIDAGADKPLPFLTDAEEPNPAPGVRAYRTSWEKRSVLTNQLDAIAAAAKQTDAKPWVMAPMIATVEETEDFIALCRERDLAPAGIMVETPAAALTANHHLAACDFASIGTNDLTQYTMAADRQLGSLAHLNTPWQLLRLAPGQGHLRRGPHRGRRPGGLRGEREQARGRVRRGRGRAGSRRGAGGPGREQPVDGTALLPAVAKVLSTVTLEQARELAAKALAARTADDAISAVRAGLPILGELGL